MLRRSSSAHVSWLTRNFWEPSVLVQAWRHLGRALQAVGKKRDMKNVTCENRGADLTFQTFKDKCSQPHL